MRPDLHIWTDSRTEDAPRPAPRRTGSRRCGRTFTSERIPAPTRSRRRWAAYSAGLGLGQPVAGRPAVGGVEDERQPGAVSGQDAHAPESGGAVLPRRPHGQPVTIEDDPD